MAKARMLHKKISISSQVSRLSLPAKLLFTWMISHADDEGKLKGDADYIKATVVPMTNWSFKKIKTYLEEIKKQGIISYWEESNEWFVEFIKWFEHQKLRKDRSTPSSLPSFSNNSDNQKTTQSQRITNHEETEDNISELKEIESNKSEYSQNQKTNIADINPFKKRIGNLINPKGFVPASEGEAAALEVWQQLEPKNPFSLQTTYLKASRGGLPSSMFYQFASEIKQDLTIKNPGAVFNKKVQDYLKKGSI